MYASPRQTVIAGPTAPIDTIIAMPGAQHLRPQGEHGGPVSPRDDGPRTPRVAGGVGEVAPKTPNIPVISTTLENSGGATLFDANHWAANVRNPVRFHQAIATAGVAHSTFIEISPHPMLTKAVTDTLDGRHHHSLRTLQRDTHDTHTFHTNLNAAHCTSPPHTDHPPDHIPPPRHPLAPHSALDQGRTCAASNSTPPTDSV